MTTHKDDSGIDGKKVIGIVALGALLFRFARGILKLALSLGAIAGGVWAGSKLVERVTGQSDGQGGGHGGDVRQPTLDEVGV
jgi:hypothetical protein